MIKRVLVLSGSPNAGSFSEELANTYSQAAKANFSVRQIKMSQMDFKPHLHDNHKPKELINDPAIQEIRQSLNWADHILITTPVWWGALPAKFRQVISQAITSDCPFVRDHHHATNKPLRQKTARIIMAMDAPPWHYTLIEGAPALKQLAVAKLHKHGIKKAKYSLWGPVNNATDTERSNWVLQAMLLGRYAQ